MLFNSFRFILVFLPGVLACHWIVRRRFQPRSAQVLLLVASLVFYAWSRPSSLLFLGLSILFNFAAAEAISKASQPERRRRMLALGLTANVLFLGVLKYSKFAQATLLSLTGLHIPVPDLGLPLGVSFFTIQQIMYLVDCYEELVPSHGLLDHASFVAFFPYLSMGPLARARQMIPQLRTGGDGDAEQFAKGSFLFAMGLCKKVMVAQALASLADSGFTLPSGLSCAEAWAACLAYTLQIYFDFSGYTDMALGIGLMLGLQIPPNFNSPFKATSIIEFWQRWHITLSQFITTYLYTPILRTFRKATLQTAAITTLIAMAIAGLWHGPSWNYIIFGVIHGIALVTNQYWRKKVRIKLPSFIAWPLTLGLVTLAFVFFRSATFPEALNMLKALVPSRHLLGSTMMNSIGRVDFAFSALLFVLGFLAAILGPNSNEWAERLRPTFRAAVAVAVMLVVGVFYLNSSTAQEFIYFAF